MKKIFSIIAVSVLGLTLYSCSSDDPEYDSTEIISASQGNFEFNSENLWTLNDQPGDISIKNFEFSHAVPYDGYVNGFTPSKISDTKEYSPRYSMPYASMAGGGINGPSDPYLVGYWDNYLEGEGVSFEGRSCRIWEEQLEEFEPVSVMVCNTSYLYYEVLYGTAGMSKKFEKGDWVTLTAHGVHSDNTETTAVKYLVNVETDDVADGIVTSWEAFDLSSLGVCTGIYFTMESSDNSSYGMNTPAYFCIDKFTVKE